jgi:alpha/beta superfamily hydrolase
MRQTAISFRSEKLNLEGVVGWPDQPSGGLPVAVVCPPHPTLSGDMENPLVLAICQALDRRGVATVRFNFRGVGQSEGDFSNGKQESRDIEAALRLARRWPGCDGKRVGLVGHSFAAAVILRDLGRVKSARAVALVSPPVAAATQSLARLARQRRLLVLAGDADRIAPSERLAALVETSGGRAQMEVVAGAAHDWRGHEADAAERVARFLSAAFA